ncbi:MAG: ketoacyl-ACP synthase III [Deltaproteobacteria bacterium]|nr:ketoacyl-ACP synthase III [Deltaproteobacteria bacterium]
MKKGVSLETIEKWGVFEHRVIGDDETTTDMEASAAMNALDMAGIAPEAIDLIISCTAVSRQVGIPNANALQNKIGAANAAGFDVTMACGSAIPSILVAAQFIAAGLYRYALVTGSSDATTVADPTDPPSFVVLGDGAGAMVVGSGKDERSGILSFDMQSKGEYFDYCGFKVKKPKISAADSQERLYFYIKELEDSYSEFRDYLIESVPNSVNISLSRAGITVDNIDFYIAHQNINTISGMWVKKLGIPPEKTHLTYHKYGNMTSANIFVNLDEALQANRIKKGDIVLFAGQGAGFSVGSIVMKW